MNSGPSATALPVTGLTRYTMLSLPTPYSSPVAGRKSMPVRLTPIGSPLIGRELSSWRGLSAEKLTRLP